MSSESDSIDIAAARHEIVSWLRDGALDGDPMFMLGHPERIMCLRNEEVAERFLQQLSGRDFQLKIFQVNGADVPVFESCWTFCGAAIPGILIPPLAQTYDEARVLACAVLLRNEWCRKRFA